MGRFDTGNDDAAQLAQPGCASDPEPRSPLHATAADAPPTAAPAAAPLPPGRMYWAVGIAPESAEALLGVLRALAEERGLKLKSELHCTLFFMGRAGATEAEEAPYAALNGQQCHVDVHFVAVTSRLVAARVSLVDPAVAQLCRNAHPHLTVALGDRVPAVESNAVLAAVAAGSSDADVVPMRCRLHGVVEPRRF